MLVGCANAFYLLFSSLPDSQDPPNDTFLNTDQFYNTLFGTFSTLLLTEIQVKIVVEQASLRLALFFFFLLRLSTSSLRKENDSLCVVVLFLLYVIILLLR